MSLDHVSQVWIALCGMPALWLMQSERDRWRAIAVLLGLAGQPAWYAQLVIHEQWILLPVYAGYTAGWVRGWWKHFGPGKPWITQQEGEGTP